MRPRLPALAGRRGRFHFGMVEPAAVEIAIIAAVKKDA
jgi:hypothetical protein